MGRGMIPSNPVNPVNPVKKNAPTLTELARRLAFVKSRRVAGQSQFNFDHDGTERGYTRWVDGRRVAVKALAQRMGLPLEHQVEVWLYGGIRLRGKLRLQEETLFIEEERVRHLELVVDNVTFTYREMESCVRLD